MIKQHPYIKNITSQPLVEHQLRAWAVTASLVDASILPQSASSGTFKLMGKIYGDVKDRFPNKTVITTGEITDMQLGSCFKTKNGSVYRILSWAASPK